MKDLPRMKDVVSALAEGVRAANLDEPPAVSVKIRSGWDSSSLNYLEAAQGAAEAGAGLVSLHSRTRVQGYSGRANWEHLKHLKESVDIPVIGSGDLFSAEAALAMFEQTGCDGVMFSRGASATRGYSNRQRRCLQPAASRRRRTTARGFQQPSPTSALPWSSTAKRRPAAR